MSNIFLKLGRKLEEDKKERQRFKDKYWKLEASERLHYDFKLNKINEWIDFVFPKLTIFYFKAIFWIMIFLLMINYTFGGIILENIKTIFANLLNVIPIILFADLLLTLVCIHIHSKELKELNKRFKLK